MIQHPQTSVTHLLNKTKNKNYKITSIDAEKILDEIQHPSMIKNNNNKTKNLDKVDIEGPYINILGLLGCLSGRICLPMQEAEEMQVRSLGWKIPWRRKWQPTPVFLPGKFHGQESLVGYSPWGCKELDTTEQLSTSTY